MRSFFSLVRAARSFCLWSPGISSRKDACSIACAGANDCSSVVSFHSSLLVPYVFPSQVVPSVRSIGSETCSFSFPCCCFVSPPSLPPIHLFHDHVSFARASHVHVLPPRSHPPAGASRRRRRPPPALSRRPGRPGRSAWPSATFHTRVSCAGALASGSHVVRSTCTCVASHRSSVHLPHVCHRSHRKARKGPPPFRSDAISPFEGTRKGDRRWVRGEDAPSSTIPRGRDRTVGEKNKERKPWKKK